MGTRFISCSESMTERLAGGIASILVPGDIVFLYGELGAGKTTFIRAAARAMSVKEPVTSPSFTMAQSYGGSCVIHHLDLYRLARFTSDDAAELETFFEGDAVTFVEWPEPLEGFIQPQIKIRFSHIDINNRGITIECSAELMKQLEDYLAAIGD